MVRSTFFAAILGAAMLSLSACGGGGGGSSDPAAQTAKPSATTSTPATASATAAPAHVYILFEGDSTMHGSDANFCQNSGCQNVAGNEPVIDAALLNHLFGSESVSAINGAVPSTYLQQMLPGGNAYYPYSYPTVLENVPAQIVVSNHAINDSVMETQAQYEIYLNNFIDDTLAAGKIPVLEEPNPVCDGKHPNLDAFVIIMRSVAAQRNVLLVQQYDAFKLTPNWQAYLSDCVHPNTDGYAMKARITAPALATLVQKIRGG